MTSIDELLVKELERYRSLGRYSSIVQQLSTLSRYEEFGDLDELESDKKLLEEYQEFGSIRDIDNLCNDTESLMTSYTQLVLLFKDLQDKEDNKVYLQLLECRALLHKYRDSFEHVVDRLRSILRKHGWYRVPTPE